MLPPDSAVHAADLALQQSAAVPLSAEASVWPDFTWLSELVREFAEWMAGFVEHATGWVGLGIIAVYSFLIAFAIPGVSEVVLAAPLDLGIGFWPQMAVIVLVSGVAKALGSVFAFHIGQEAKQSGPIIRWLRRSRFDIVEWSETKTLQLAREYGYGGLALALCVPGFPDTLSIYAFAVLERDYTKFAIATFIGSVGRLVLTLALWQLGLTALEVA